MSATNEMTETIDESEIGEESLLEFDEFDGDDDDRPTITLDISKGIDEKTYSNFLEQYEKSPGIERFEGLELIVEVATNTHSSESVSYILRIANILTKRGNVTYRVSSPEFEDLDKCSQEDASLNESLSQLNEKSRTTSVPSTPTLTSGSEERNKPPIPAPVIEPKTIVYKTEPPRPKFAPRVIPHLRRR